MKVAIHHDKKSFSTRWIEYCIENNINYELVNCYDSNIVEQLKCFDILLFNWWHHDVKAALFMRQLTMSLESINIKVFPDSATSWHYDDKVGQKYLLEALDLPLVPSYVFYDRKQALLWAEVAEFPKVFKLRGGAGAMNVKLVHDENQARKYIRKAFTSGFSVSDRFSIFKDRILQLKGNFSTENIIGLLKGIARLLVPTEQERMQPKQKGYVYFQDFIPNNDSDMRIIVIGNKAFGMKRYVRDGDFRASGSLKSSFLKNDIDENCIQIAFDTTKKIKVQSVAFDFVFKNGVPLIVEISYAFSMRSFEKYEGYWKDDLTFVKGAFNPQDFIIENVLNS
ncbi:ATP-grasp domain-containing protein [Vibrio breoganii]|uniref:ATP-grasp domain-containing protein n=1 Tax=Vibrio breoganii TaxID=553239 RepID=UPI000C849071|nr:hypothetical protein [Vibrio breoganii]PML94609.1 hypothetical protein BCT64_11035 [Vibrio breoganii]PMN72789.1 hypothetical protein BCT28_16810 [Vibrio breoganii]